MAERHKYIAAYYYDNGTPGTLDHARKDAVRISKMNGGAMVYINRDYPGNPMAAVYREDNGWVYELRWKSGSWFFDPKTGKLKEEYFEHYKKKKRH